MTTQFSTNQNIESNENGISFFEFEGIYGFVSIFMQTKNIRVSYMLLREADKVK